MDGQPIVVQSAYAEMEVYGRGFAPTATRESLDTPYHRGLTSLKDEKNRSISEGSSNA